MIFHPGTGKTAALALTVEAACRCGWYRVADGVPPCDRVAVTRLLEWAAHEHETRNARRAYAHDATVTAVAA